MVEDLKRTPLAEEHINLGARMVDFGGWYMPVQYSGLVAEHQAVREKVGLFDVSHMGEVRVTGKDAIAYLEYVTVNKVSSLEDGQAHYTAMAYPEGTVVDDLLIYRHHAENYLLVVNASNIEKDYAWLCQHTGDWDVVVTNESDRTAQIAVQGPQSVALLQELITEDLSSIGYYRFIEAEVGGISGLISRTGYTGEDGFECYIPADQAVTLWRLLLEKGEPYGIQPAGLGARDTLRLEARMHLYGNDMDKTTTLLEAGLGWITKLKKSSDFIGKDALKAQKKEGVKRKLVGFEVTSKGIARHGHPIVDGDEEIGQVTSGSHSPTLKKSIGLAYVPPEYSSPGTELQIKVRNKIMTANVIKGAFYKRS